MSVVKSELIPGSIENGPILMITVNDEMHSLFKRTATGIFEDMFDFPKERFLAQSLTVEISETIALPHDIFSEKKQKDHLFVI